MTETTIPPVWSVPKSARLISAHKSLPDIFNLNESTLVNQCVYDCIVSLEPNVHQFFPIILEKKNEEPFRGNFYLLNICQRLDSVIIEKSNVELVISKSGRSDIPDLRYYVSKRGAGIVDFRYLRKSLIAGKHLWREEITSGYFFFSDALHDQFMKERFTRIDDWFRAYEE